MSGEVTNICLKIMSGRRLVVVGQRCVEGDCVAVDRGYGPRLILAAGSGADEQQCVADFPVLKATIDFDGFGASLGAVLKGHVALFFGALDVDMAKGDETVA